MPAATGLVTASLRLPPFHSPTLHSISAKSRDKMHNNFIHSGRCHKSVLNRVNNFVLRLPGQFLNCQESCCESGMSFRPTPPCTPLHPFACWPASFAFIALLGNLSLLAWSPGAMAWPIHTCSLSINCACWNVSAALLELHLVIDAINYNLSSINSRKKKQSTSCT